MDSAGQNGRAHRTTHNTHRIRPEVQKSTWPHPCTHAPVALAQPKKEKPTTCVTTWKNTGRTGQDQQSPTVSTVFALNARAYNLQQTSEFVSSTRRRTHEWHLDGPLVRRMTCLMTVMFRLLKTRRINSLGVPRMSTNLKMQAKTRTTTTGIASTDRGETQAWQQSRQCCLSSPK